ncbi:hypothetical protein [Methylibium rhizosphaerae]|uniref:hypothetical protein n=1 Tax=Methylibium rhizosphaerae TaxID=2570323 RepID=UPI00112ED40D|nr:hypothetical protein [Methylibium rhizosphaerae]
MTFALISIVKLQAIDDSNRSAHYYLAPDDECYFLHEFTARKGFGFSPGNQFIFNFKKSPTKRLEAQYQHKVKAIRWAIATYRSIFDQVAGVYEGATFSPIPPSKASDHAEYDDRMWQVVSGICEGKGADARELIRQRGSYEASHLGGEAGSRIKPTQLQGLYELPGGPPKALVMLFDDVLSAGCHFRAAKSAILAAYPATRVVGFFLARRVLPDPLDDFETLL